MKQSAPARGRSGAPKKNSTLSRAVLELVADFHGAVDDYLALCEREGDAPEVAYKGSLNVRLGGDLHKRAAVYAMTHQQSLNSFIEDAVRDKLTAAGA